MTSTVKRLAIALTSTTAIVAAFTLAATPPTVEVATASPAPGISLVIDLTEQHGTPLEAGTTAAADDSAAADKTAAWSRSVRDC